MQCIRSTNDRGGPVTGTGKGICASKASKVSTNCLSDYAVVRAVVRSVPWPFRLTERSLPQPAMTTRSACGMWKRAPASTHLKAMGECLQSPKPVHGPRSNTLLRTASILYEGLQQYKTV